MRPLIALLLLLLLLLLWLLLPLAAALSLSLSHPASGQGQLFVVTTPSDAGDGLCDQSCTLRDALLAANMAGADGQVTFNVGAGPVRIVPTTPLPMITAPGTVIDATTQPGWTADPIVMIDGDAAGETSGLVSTAADVEFRGLIVGDFEQYGLVAMGATANGNRFLGNWLGLDRSGTAAAPNGRGGIGVLGGAADARIGDTCAACGNRLAGNSVPARTGHGLVIGGAGSSAARIVNNAIGLASDGAALPNDDGILIVDGGRATIGGPAADERNLISGNRVAGIELRDTGTGSLRIEGNWIGLSQSGADTIGNDVGLFVHGDTTQLIVGGPTPSARNVISGNRVGIALEQGARDIAIEGNWFGLDAGGSTALPNTEDGLSLLAGTEDVTIGGDATSQGNRIIGGANAIVVVAATATVIQNNDIGLMPDGSLEGQNVAITLRGGAARTLLSDNRIAGSAGPAVLLLDGATERNRITRNAFLGNAGIAIDLGGDGPTPNDAGDTDTGPNGRLNAPAILDAADDTVRGSAPPGATVELYSVTAPGAALADQSGFGPGGEFLGDTDANATGDWSLTAALPPAAPLTAIAIDADGNTSEFSANFLGEEITLALSSGFTPVGWFGPALDPALAFGAIAQRLEAAFRYDPLAQTWDVHRPDFPFLSDLGTLQPGDALWLLISPGPAIDWPQPAALPGGRDLTLPRGLNFVTWTGPPTEAADAVAPLSGRLSTLFRWNPDREAFEVVFPALPIPGLVTLLQPRDVLWLRLTAPATWQQP